MRAPGSTAGELSIGSTLGNYTIVSFVGRGGMGAVYQGEHSFLGRKAAIKVLLPQFSQDAELVDRFFKEARATARLRHPAFVEVFDSGSLPGGSAYLIMEMLDGENLAAHVERRQRMPVGEAIAVARAIANGVGYAHRHGIVHRDLKPDNIFLARSSDPDDAGAISIKVLDFGIAKLAGSNDSVGSGTRTGAVMGTPHYMAPEQCRGSGRVAIDHRADIYALGCIVHAMLAGNPPFPLEGFGEILAAHLSEPPPPLRTLAPDVPVELEVLVLRLLAKEADERPPSMEHVEEELGRLQAGLGLDPAGFAALAPSGRSSGTGRAAAPLPTPRTAYPGAATPAPAARTPAPGVAQAGGTRVLTRERPRHVGTLTGSAAERTERRHPPPRGRRLGVVSAVATLVAAAGVLIAVKLTRDGGTDRPPPDEPAPVAAAPPAPPPSAPAPPPPAAAEAPPRAPSPPPEAPPPSEPAAASAGPSRPAPGERTGRAPSGAHVTVSISSTPPGAEVVDGRTGGVVGTTPFEQMLPRRHDAARFSVRKDGFARKEIKLRLDRDARINVTLDRQPSSAAPPRSELPPAPRNDDDDDDRRKL